MAQWYRHRQFDERSQIRALHTHGVSISKIARQLGPARTRQVNQQPRSRRDGLLHRQAQRSAAQRRSAASSGPQKLTPVIWGIVRALLLQ